MLTAADTVAALQARLSAVPGAVQAGVQAALAAYARAAAPAKDKARALRDASRKDRGRRLHPDRDKALAQLNPASRATAGAQAGRPGAAGAPLSRARRAEMSMLDLKTAAVQGALQALGRP